MELILPESFAICINSKKFLIPTLNISWVLWKIWYSYWRTIHILRKNVKFRYSEKAKKIWPIASSTYNLTFWRYDVPNLCGRAQRDWAYEFPDRTGLDTQICRTGSAGLVFLTFYLTSMGYQFSYDKVPGHKFGVKKSKLGCIWK